MYHSWSRLSLPVSAKTRLTEQTARCFRVEAAYEKNDGPGLPLEVTVLTANHSNLN